jgi:hypothetical protein
MNKPTDGPWEIKHSQTKDAWNIVGTRLSDLYKIARLPYIQDKRMGVQWNEDQKAEQLANARLIAASPDLLEELEQLIQWAEYAGWPASELVDAKKAVARAKGYE